MLTVVINTSHRYITLTEIFDFHHCIFLNMLPIAFSRSHCCKRQ